jgi:hypothetical protein
MKKLLSIAACIVAVTTNAQQCKYELDELDVFTKQRHVVTEANLSLSVSVATRYLFDLTGDEYRLKFKLTNSAVSAVPAEGVLYVKLANDSVLMFRATATAEPEWNELYRWVNVTYEADRARFESMSLSPVVRVRIMFQSSSLEYEVDQTRKNQAKIQQAVRCLLEKTGGL